MSRGPNPDRREPLGELRQTDERSGNHTPNVRDGVTAEVGDLTFYDEFSDPDVEVTHDRDTTDHELVTGHSAYRREGVEFVIQAMGRNAPEIDISGWVSKDQLSIADDLVGESRVRINSNRWSGAAVPLRVDINYSRHYHDKHGQMFEVDIELLGTDRNGYPDTGQNSGLDRGEQDSGLDWGDLDFDGRNRGR